MKTLLRNSQKTHINIPKEIWSEKLDWDLNQEVYVKTKGKKPHWESGRIVIYGNVLDSLGVVQGGNIQEEEDPLVWKHNKNHISCYIGGKERYWISRERCKTKEEQFDWISQINSKNWSKSSFQFTKAFKKALKDWGLW